MATARVKSLVAKIITLAVEAVEASDRADSLGGQVAATMALIYPLVVADDKAWAEVFGNGVKGKLHVPGSIRAGVEPVIAELSDEKRKKIRAMLAVRASDARKLRALGGMPAKGELLSSALKRYEQPKPAAERKARPEGNTTEHFVIPPELTVQGFAEAFSIYMRDQSPAKIAAIAAELRSMLTPAKTTVRKLA